MIRTNGTRAARYRNAIVTAAIAIVVLCGGRASAWAASTGMPATPVASATTGTAEGLPTRGATPATPTAPPMADSYADRETSARDLAKFKGGDIVIIGSTGVIVVLLVVIILLSL